MDHWFYYHCFLEGWAPVQPEGRASLPGRSRGGRGVQGATSLTLRMKTKSSCTFPAALLVICSWVPAQPGAWHRQRSPAPSTREPLLRPALLQKLHKRPATPFWNGKSDTQFELGGATTQVQNLKMWHNRVVYNPVSVFFLTVYTRMKNQQTEATPADASSWKICSYIRCLVCVRVFPPEPWNVLCRKKNFNKESRILILNSRMSEVH